MTRLSATSNRRRSWLLPALPVVAVLAASVVAGFVAAARVVAFGDDMLIWVFPLVCFRYGAMRWLLARRYGGAGFR